VTNSSGFEVTKLSYTTTPSSRFLIHVKGVLKPVSSAAASLTRVQIDFQVLDESVISPIGIYGSRSKIIAWLLDSGVVTEDM
jgi:hypothetical protein